MTEEKPVKTNRLSLFFLAIFFGGGAAILGYNELSKRNASSYKANYKANWLEEKLAKRHSLDALKLISVLHGNDNIETLARHPELVPQKKSPQGKLDGKDQSSLKKLIDKVTTK